MKLQLVASLHRLILPPDGRDLVEIGKQLMDVHEPITQVSQLAHSSSMKSESLLIERNSKSKSLSSKGYEFKRRKPSTKEEQSTKKIPILI